VLFRSKYLLQRIMISPNFWGNVRKIVIFAVFDACDIGLFMSFQQN